MVTRRGLVPRPDLIIRAIFLGQIWDNLITKPCLFRPMEHSSVVRRNLSKLLKIK